MSHELVTHATPVKAAPVSIALGELSGEEWGAVYQFLVERRRLRAAGQGVLITRFFALRPDEFCSGERVSHGLYRMARTLAQAPGDAILTPGAAG